MKNWKVNSKMLKYVILAAALLTVLPVQVPVQNWTVDFAAKSLSPYYVLNASEYTGYETSASQNSDTNTSTYKCGRGQVIDFGSKRLATNLWGAPLDENISLDDNCVFKNYDGTFGWTWNRTVPVALSGENIPSPIYPSVGTGTDPWGGYSTSKYLPVRIMDIGSFTLEVRYRYSALPSPSDSVNFAYDIWITDTDKPNPETPRKEVMIWLNRLNVPMPEDKRLEDVSDGYNTYRQYAIENTTAFIIDAVPLSGVKYQKANPGKLIDYLVAKGDLNGNLWISKIDLGSEVWKSQGKIEIFKLYIKINNTLI